MEIYRELPAKLGKIPENYRIFFLFCNKIFGFRGEIRKFAHGIFKFRGRILGIVPSIFHFTQR